MNREILFRYLVKLQLEINFFWKEIVETKIPISKLRLQETDSYFNYTKTIFDIFLINFLRFNRGILFQYLVKLQLEINLFWKEIVKTKIPISKLRLQETASCFKLHKNYFRCIFN